MSDIYNRYTVQVLCTVDSADSSVSQKQIKEALNALPKTRVKQISFDEWVNGMDGSERRFDENGKEILADAAPSATTATTPTATEATPTATE